MDSHPSSFTVLLVEENGMPPYMQARKGLGAMDGHETTRDIAPLGRPLPEDLRRQAEELFQQDFSEVRIHVDPEARRKKVRAFTSGTRIYVAPEEDVLTSENGLRLLGHELAHVVQQRTGRVRNPHGYGVAVVRDPGLEAEADRMGEAFARRFRATRAQARRSPLAAPRAVQLSLASNGSQDELPVVGLSTSVMGKVKQGHLETILEHALSLGIPPELIEIVFGTLSPSQLEKLPDAGAPGPWLELKKARLLLGDAGLRKWLGIVGLAACEIPGFQMLLTDKKVEAAYHQSSEILQENEPPPSFMGKSYAQIVKLLQEENYIRLESYTDARAGTAPYGQDVWANAGYMVVRIKVGGRSLNGRFQRPPHVVKEITSQPFEYAPDSIICKLTDDNGLIPAGTKYSAKDMQTWYVGKSRRQLRAEAWKDPASSGDDDFTELHQLWAEGAHIPIGAVPPVPRIPLGEVAQLQHALDELENKIQVGRMEKHGIDQSVIDDEPSTYLTEEEFMRWCFLRHQLGIS